MKNSVFKKLFSLKLLPIYFILLYIITYKSTNTSSYGFLGSNVYIYYLLLLFIYSLITYIHHILYKYCSSLACKVVFYLNIILFSWSTALIFPSSFSEIYEYNFISGNLSAKFFSSVILFQILLLFITPLLVIIQNKKRLENP